MENTLIQKAGASDLLLIEKLALEIWPSTFAEILSIEQIEYMLNMMYHQVVLKNQLLNGHTFYLLFEDNIPIGFIGIEHHFQNTDQTKIHKIYLLPSKQGKGYGKLLIDFVENEAKSFNSQSLLLNVNRYNKAVKFYQKIDFEIIKEEDIDIGNNFFMNDFVMIKSIH